MCTYIYIYKTLCLKYRLKYIPVDSFIRDNDDDATIRSMRKKCVNAEHVLLYGPRDGDTRDKRRKKSARIHFRYSERNRYTAHCD